MSTSKIYQTSRRLKNMRPFAQILACYRATPIIDRGARTNFCLERNVRRISQKHVKCTNLKSIGDRNVVEFRLGKNCIQNQMYLYQVPWPEFMSSKVCRLPLRCADRNLRWYTSRSLSCYGWGLFDTPNSVETAPFRASTS